MNDNDTPAPEDETTGLPWPRTWNGAYLFVIGSFVLWVAALITLGAVFK